MRNNKQPFVIASLLVLVVALIGWVPLHAAGTAGVTPPTIAPYKANASLRSNEALRGVYIFHSGPSSHSALRAMIAPQQAYGPGREYQNIVTLSGSSASKFTLTPRQPYLDSQGFIEVFNTPGYSDNDNLIFIGNNPLLDNVSVVVDATAGQTYLFDVAVAASSPGSGCQYVVYGPAGQQNSYPCNNTNGHQHLVFAYAAGQTGQAWFGVTISNQYGGFFYSATVSPV
jgi:hypothetical protein